MLFRSGYTDNTLASNIKLASGSNFGSITTPSLNLSTATIITVRAKQFGTDAGAKLTLKANGDSITSLVTAVANQDFTVNIPAKTSTSSIALSAVKGARVYVDYVKLTTQGIAQTPVSVIGYPKSVGNVLTYAVTSLLSDSTYYYTVTPEGNSTTISDKVKVHTATSVLTEELENRLGYKIVVGEGIQIIGIPEGCMVTILDMLGKQIKSENSSSEIKFRLPQKGLYLLQIQRNQEFKTYKIIF